MTTTCFKNVRLLSSILSPSSLYDVLCSPSGITSILPASTPPSDLEVDQKDDHLPQLWDRTTLVQENGITVVDGKGSWLMPGLNHPHLHLDKSYLLGEGSSVPGSSHSCGIIETGDFDEAMSKTLKAKSLFTSTSVTTRSSTLLSLSLSCGVTSLTTHVEVDPSLSPPNLSLLSALEFKRAWKGKIDIRVVVFAQEASFVDGPVGEERRRVIEEACEMEDVDAVGSAPYVEKAEEGDEVDEGDPTGGRGARNVEWVFELAERWGLDVDFHLDYDLDPSRHPLIWTVLAEARSQPAFHLPPSFVPSTTTSLPLPTIHPSSSSAPPPQIKHRTLTLGHTTHLSLLTPSQLSLLETKAQGLDVTFVALPTSDLYMMGRDAPTWRERGRGSFDIWELERRGMKVLMGLNNISNLFTPSSNPDPLAVLPSLSIPLFQSALPSSQLKLLEMIVLPRTITTTTAASPSAQLPRPSSSTSTSPPSSMSLEVGSKADLLLVHGSTSLREVVGNPGWGRTVVKDGRVVARREGRGWIASGWSE